MEFPLRKAFPKIRPITYTHILAIIIPPEYKPLDLEELLRRIKFLPIIEPSTIGVVMSFYICYFKDL